MRDPLAQTPDGGRWAITSVYSVQGWERSLVGSSGCMKAHLLICRERSKEIYPDSL